MNLISCTNCASVYDADYLPFPRKTMVKSDGSIDLDKAEWNGECYIPKVDCPRCGYAILDPRAKENN